MDGRLLIARSLPQGRPTSYFWDPAPPISLLAVSPSAASMSVRSFLFLSGQHMKNEDGGLMIASSHEWNVGSCQIAHKQATRKSRRF